MYLQTFQKIRKPTVHNTPGIDSISVDKINFTTTRTTMSETSPMGGAIPLTPSTTTEQMLKKILSEISDISKTLFGTLSDKDLEQINNEFDNIYKDNKKLADVLTNHTKILKLILDSSSRDYKNLKGKVNAESDTLKNLGFGVNANTLNNFVNSKLMLATLLIDEMDDDVNIAINAINVGKDGVVHPQILKPKILKSAVEEFEKKHRTRHHFDNDESNYQHLIDISKLTRQN